MKASAWRGKGARFHAAGPFSEQELAAMLDAARVEMQMPGGSTGKTFVATLTMLLVEEGVLSLDDLISTWLADEPWFGSLPNAEFIKVRHLLSHSAGLHDYPGSPGFLAKMVWRVVSDRSFTAMLQGEWRDPDLPWHYGYGFFVRSGQRIEHGGLWPGYRTHMAHFMQSAKWCDHRGADQSRRRC